MIVTADSELASAAVRGERQAFSELMTRHQVGIHRFVSRFVRGENAADVTQDTFVAAWRNLARFDPSQRFDVWLRAIAINKCRDHARRAAVRRFISVDLAQAPADSVDDGLISPETATEERQTLALLHRAIQALPASLREPLVLTALEGLSQADAGSVLGVSVKSIETRLYRARRKLADQLNLDLE